MAHTPPDDLTAAQREVARRVPEDVSVRGVTHDAVCEPAHEDRCTCDTRDEYPDLCIVLYQDAAGDIWWWLTCRTCDVLMAIRVLD